MPKSFAPVAALAVAGLLCPVAEAQLPAQPELTPEEQKSLAEMRALWESLDRRSGAIELADSLVTLDVPESFYFLDAEDTDRVLVAWGNPPGQQNLGMLIPAEYTPFDSEAWAVTIEYEGDGYVSDSDAKDIDYTALLQDMRSDIRDSNPERASAGYPTVELVGWAEPPHYEAATHKLYWAKELRFGESADSTLNYEIRALGRSGVLSMTFIAATEQLAEINERRDAVLDMAEFNAGQRYEDFDSNVDEIAAYGIGALIAGKVAAKAGLLGVVLLFAKKFGVFALLGLAAAGRKIKGLLSGNARAS